MNAVVIEFYNKISQKYARCFGYVVTAEINVKMEDSDKKKLQDARGGNKNKKIPTRLYSIFTYHTQLIPTKKLIRGKSRNLYVIFSSFGGQRLDLLFAP